MRTKERSLLLLLLLYALCSDEAEYRETCSHQHSIGCEEFFFMSISHMLQSKMEFYQQIAECRHIHRILLLLIFSFSP